ncbi:MAG: phosphate ABC transporter substrate-binding protein [Methanosarcinales archaeon]|nr:phosphate ABC transporter substrate-binding protein [Methanosarcinales archaeon]
MKKLSVLVLLASLMALFAGCLSDDQSSRAMLVPISGSTTVLPLAEVCAEEYNQLQKQYMVSITGGGSGAGITNVAEGRSSIGMASREIKDSEKDNYETADKKFQEHVIGYDGIILVVSPAVYRSGVTGLSTEQVRGIYSGRISNWKEVGGEDHMIYTVGRKGGSGTRDTFDEAIMGSKQAETPGVDTEAAENSEVKTAIVGSDWAIGYLGYSYISEGKVKPIALDGVTPTVESIKDGSYVLARKLYFYTYGEPTPGAQAFIDFVRGPTGRAIAEENGYIST